MKELMIGDCVFVKSKNKTGVVHEIYARSAHVWCGETYGSVYSDRYDYDDIEPIPLTPEILEKNGFKDAPAKDTDVHNLVGKWWHKSGDVYVKKYCLSHGTYAYTIGFHPHTRIENIHNVHELQHALRLCGLDILADNFKILDDYERS